jgi:tetratricopeptide (TPR) repeat protein
MDMKAIVAIVIFLFSSIIPMDSFAQKGTQLLRLLEMGDFNHLEFATKQIQSEFENGSLSEIELRNTYRPFYNLTPETLAKVQEWERKFPTSYAAHLIRGTYYKKKGMKARGTKYISETPQENIRMMHEYYKIARTELNASLELTEKPFLSVFHLLTISMDEGSKETSLALLMSANKMLPNNTLVRNRFMISLEPRWGGSYEEMNNFIAKSQEEGLNAAGLMQLKAIMYDDMGFTAKEAGDKRSAIEYFSKALELADRVGGEFRKDFLSHSNYYTCREPSLKKYCQSISLQQIDNESPDQPSSKLSAPSSNAVIKDDAVSVYSEPKVKSKVVKSLKKGDVVVVEFEIDRSDEAWCGITEKGENAMRGYIQCRYLEREKGQ